MDDEVIVCEEKKPRDDYEMMKTVAKEALIDSVTVFSFSWVLYQIGNFFQDAGTLFQKAKGYFGK